MPTTRACSRQRIPPEGSPKNTAEIVLSLLVLRHAVDKYDPYRDEEHPQENRQADTDLARRSDDRAVRTGLHHKKDERSGSHGDDQNDEHQTHDEQQEKRLRGSRSRHIHHPTCEKGC